MKCSPVTGFAYGLAPGDLRYQTSAQPIRPPRCCSGTRCAPYAHVSIRTRSRSVIPRWASASITRGSLRSAASHSLNSSTVMFGWPSVWRSQRVTAGGSSVTRAL